MQKEIHFWVVPKRVFLGLKLENYSVEFLDYIKNRYAAFIKDKIKPKSRLCYRGFLKKDILKCRSCVDKEVLEIPDFKNIDVCFSIKNKTFCFFTIENKYLFDSVLRIIYSIILADNKGLLLHSAGVIKDKVSFLYVGPTNSGKSTLSKKFTLEDVISDELCPVITDKEKVFCWKSPFFSEVRVVYDDLKFFRLKQIYFLSGFSFRKRTLKIDDKDALESILKNTFWLAKNKSLNEKLIGVAHRIVEGCVKKRLYLKNYEIQDKS